MCIRDRDKTSLFNIKDIDNRFISDILEEVWDSLEERGYITGSISIHSSRTAFP